MIEVKSVNYTYRSGLKALQNINLHFEKGEFVCIIGKNGSGKSTLARLIAGVSEPSSGEILVDKINTKDKKMFLELRKKVGIVFQNPENQILFNNVHDELSFGLNNLNIKNIEPRILSSLEKVGMIDFLHRDTYEMSLGQKQRITIASVLAVNPSYLVFDEPTTMIDSIGKEDIYNILSSLKNQGYTIIYVTNLIDEILLSDKIVVLDGGKIVRKFNKKDILDNVDFLHENKIKIPDVVNTLATLRSRGISISLDEWTLQELTGKLIDMLSPK